MIHESRYWKEPLLATAERLRAGKAKSTEELLDDELSAQIERDIFIGFYAVRKLIEAVAKVTDTTKNTRWQVSSYENRAPVNWRNRYDLDKIYDYEKKHQETRDLKFITGRLIHSFIFAPYVGEHGGLEGIMFTSDTDKNNKLYSMKIDDVIAIFERVGKDDPTDIVSCRDSDSGEWVTTAS